MRPIAIAPWAGSLHGDFERGWPEAEWRLKCRNPPGFRVAQPRWTGEHLGGKTIVLHWEQGLGDTLQFIRFAPQVADRGGRVWVVSQPSLARLVARCNGVERVFDGTAPLPPFDVHAPLMSIPAIIGTTLSSLPETPYLSADTATIEHWRGVLTRALGVADLNSVYKIGIAWQGNPAEQDRSLAVLPAHLLAPLARIPGVRLISLQKGPGTEQLRALDGQFPVARAGSTDRGARSLAAISSIRPP